MTALRPAASAIREAFAEFDLDGSGDLDHAEVETGAMEGALALITHPGDLKEEL